METTPERKAQLENFIKSYYGEPNYNGDTIRFISGGRLIAEAPLPSFSTETIRHAIAEISGVDAYDDFEFVKEDGTIRARGSEFIIDGLATRAYSVIDYRGDVGRLEGSNYQQFLKSKICDCCGNLS